MAALGVVYGDIGTSPLYVMKTVFDPTNDLALTPANLSDIVSLIFLSLTVVVTLKYVTLIFRPCLSVVIDPGRGNVRVPQPLLNLGNVGLVVERIGRSRRPQRVRPDLEPQRLGIPPHDLVDRIGRNRLLRPFDSSVVNSAC